MSKNPELSLVVPCYNEQDNVKEFYNVCCATFAGKVEDYEIIFINDGSKDNTWQALQEIWQDSRRVKILNLSRNFGKEAAMYAGLQKAEGALVTVIDADLQQHPEVVVEMVEFLRANPDYDCVAAYQKERKEGKILSFFKGCFYKLINGLCEIPFRAGASDFRTFRKEMVTAILEMKEYFRFSKGIFSWVGFNTYFMPYEVRERNAGNSSWSFRKLTKYAIEGIVAFTTKPLNIATYLGGLCAAFSGIYMLVVIIQKLCFGIDIPGYPTLVVLILLMGGLQMLLLGIMGQYMAKIYMEGKRRPIYLAKEYRERNEEVD